MHLIKQGFIFLIICVVITYSGGFSIAQHYCADELKITSINSTSESCDGKTTNHTQQGYNKATCCFDEFSFYQTFDYEQDKTTLAAITPNFKTSLPTKQTFNKTPIFSQEYLATPPPKLAIYKSIQRFLI